MGWFRSGCTECYVSAATWNDTEEGGGMVNIRKHFLAVRSVRQWNDLPREMEEVLSLVN